jgi:oligopeptide transport system ATP-binding protein
MVFQDPQSSLNPVFTIGHQIGEVLRAHLPLDRRETRRRAIALLERVQIPDARRRIDEYPHQLSGGTRQRALIAMAIALGPKVLIADEPTTALDVTIQAQILELLEALGRDSGMAIVLITHDLGLVARHADRVAVFYAGRVVEQGDIDTVFSAMRHPYTASLFRTIPHLDTPCGRRPHADHRPATESGVASCGMRVRAALLPRPGPRRLRVVQASARSD